MKQSTFNAAAGAIFGIIALLHAARLLFHWPVTIGSRAVPLWLSWPALLLALFLSSVAFNQKK